MTESIRLNEGSHLQRWQNGFRLTEVAVPNIKNINIVKIMQLPLNVYFLNAESRIYDINEQAVISCGYDSKKDALGSTVKKVLKQSAAEQIIANDREVVISSKQKISEDHLMRFDDVDMVALTFKFPLLNCTNIPIGIFGFSILQGGAAKQSLAASFELLMQQGLLDSHHPGLSNNDVYLSKREKDILFHIIRGRTAKETARFIGLSHRTIEHKLEQLKLKFDVSTKSELIDKLFDQFK